MKKPAGAGSGANISRMTMFLAMFVKSFFLLACLTAAIPVVWLVRHKMRDGRLKRFLLFTWK